MAFGVSGLTACLGPSPWALSLLDYVDERVLPPPPLPDQLMALTVGDAPLPLPKYDGELNPTFCSTPWKATFPPLLPCFPFFVLYWVPLGTEPLRAARRVMKEDSAVSKHLLSGTVGITRQVVNADCIHQTP